MSARVWYVFKSRLLATPGELSCREIQTRGREVRDDIHHYGNRIVMRTAQHGLAEVMEAHQTLHNIYLGLIATAVPIRATMSSRC
jgi:hypothetical protein